MPTVFDLQSRLLASYSKTQHSYKIYVSEKEGNDWNLLQIFNLDGSAPYVRAVSSNQVQSLALLEQWNAASVSYRCSIIGTIPPDSAQWYIDDGSGSDPKKVTFLSKRRLPGGSGWSVTLVAYN